MTEKQSNIVLFTLLGIVALYTLPFRGLAKLGKIFIKLHDKILWFNEFKIPSIGIVKRALMVNYKIELEKRKESIRRKREVVVK